MNLRRDPPAPLTAATLTALVRGEAPATAGALLTYVETRWSYRQPISYQILNAASEPIGTITPVDSKTRTTSVVRLADQPVLMLAVDRAGNTTVADSAGTALGEFRRRFAVFTFRMRLRAAGRGVGALIQTSVTSARVKGRDGTVARIRRSGGMRFAGASSSQLYLTRTGGAPPGALLVAAVPALDAMRKAWRRRRFMMSG